MDRERLLDLIEKLNNEALTDDESLELDALYNEFDTRPDLLNIQDEKNNRSYREKLFKNISMRTNPVPQQTRKLKLWLKFTAAASIALCLLSLFYYQNNRQEYATALIPQVIRAGGNKAILTLANGQKILLSDSLNGQVAMQSGVRITKTAGGQLVYETVSKPASNPAGQYNTVEAPAGGQWQVILPDGTHVWLNALSSIKYPVFFSSHERRVELQGEAYFEVRHNLAKPFRVISGSQTVEVLGTHFNIMAYPNEKHFKTTLLEGSVKVYTKGQARILIPGEQAQLNGPMVEVVSDVDLEDIIAWKNGYFKFNENLESIMKKISRWYDVEVIYQHRPDPGFTFEGKISRTKNLAELLSIMEYNGKVHFKIQGRRVMVLK